jgi:hypothetical protein
VTSLPFIDSENPFGSMEEKVLTIDWIHEGIMVKEVRSLIDVAL